MRLRTVLFNVHLCVGLTAALFVLILGITGSIMAFEPEIEHASAPRLWYVTPAGPARSLAGIGAVVARAFPQDTIEEYAVSTRPGLSYQVGLASRVVFVNQYTGAILGVNGGFPAWLNAVHQIHTHLLFSNRALGGNIVAGAALALFLMLCSGLYLWWPLKRISVAWRGTSRRTWFDLHNAAGILAFIFLLVLTLTGLVIGFERTTTPLFYRVTGSLPSRRPRARLTPAPGAVPIGPDSALAIARGAIPGAAPFDVEMPGPADPYVIRSRFPEDRTPGGRSLVFVDQYTGKVLFAEGSRTAPAGARLVNANRAIHTGDLFGVPSKVLMSLASLMAVAQVATGVMMWVRRKERDAG
ncbi:MAG TPA: PepSY-associated TM helix domain-containing protein [Gemmatimonadales bacterium]|nr:PepSY-associated TM helix domain-containing protein [Gemmatimonadales bacterium]